MELELNLSVNVLLMIDRFRMIVYLNSNMMLRSSVHVIYDPIILQPQCFQNIQM